MEFIQSAISEVEMSNREASHSAAESNYTGPVSLLLVPKFKTNWFRIITVFRWWAASFRMWWRCRTTSSSSSRESPRHSSHSRYVEKADRKTWLMSWRFLGRLEVSRKNPVITANNFQLSKKLIECLALSNFSCLVGENVDKVVNIFWIWKLIIHNKCSEFPNTISFNQDVLKWDW